MLVLPARADLDRAQRYFDERRFGLARLEAARCRAENPQRAELIEIWALANDLREAEAYGRLERFQPTPDCARLYLLVRASLLGSSFAPESRRRDLEQALPLCRSPEESIDVYLRLYSATPFPEDEQYWCEAAELAAGRRLPDDLLARMSFTHITMLKNRGRLAEAGYDLAVARQALRGDPTGRSRWLMARADVLEGTGRSEEARELRWQAVDAHPEPLGKMMLLKAISDRRQELNSVVGERMLSQLDRLEKDLKDSRHRLYAFRLRSIVCQETRLRQEAWLAEARRLAGNRDPEVRLLALSELGLVHHRAFLVPEAREYLRQALELSRRQPPHHRDDLFLNARPPTLLITLSVLSQVQGDFKEADELARQCLEWAKHPEDFAYRMLALTVQIQTATQTARLEDGRRILHDFLQEAESSSNWIVRSTSYVTLFNALLTTNVHPVMLLDDAPIRVDSDSPAGWLFEEVRGDPALLARLFDTLEEWRRRAGGPGAKGTAASYKGAILASLGRPLEAIEAFTQGIEDAQGSPTTQANLGLMLSRELFAQGRQAEALTVMRKAYERIQSAGALARPNRYRLALVRLLISQKQNDEAVALADLALQDRTPGDAELALVLRSRANHDLNDLKRALELKPDRLLRQEILLELARREPQGQWLSQFSGREPKAALRLVRAYLERNQPQEAEKVCEEALEKFREDYQQLPSAGRQQAAQSATLRALVDQAVELSTRLSHPQQAARWLSLWRSWEQPEAVTSPELEQLRAELTGLRHDPKFASRLASTKAQFLTTLNQLRQLNPDYESALSAQGSELLALQPQLPPGTLLVQYYLAPDAVYIQAVSHDTLRLESVRVERAQLQQSLERWRSALERPGPLPLETSARLYSLLLAPLRDLLGSHANLVILPSGELWSLPFETLQNENGRYLAETHPVSYLGAGDVLLLGQSPVRDAVGLVALGSSELPGADQEIARLGELISPARLLSGGQASFANLRSEAARSGLVHIATHSRALPERPNDSFLQLADGPLPLKKIYDLTLPPGSLVVLSSCSSGVGQRRAQRELVSLASGFRAAGAASVIAALWRIDDEATALFFPPMYRELLAGQSRAAALQSARLAMLREPRYQHPFYWGAFTLVGDPR